MKSLFLTGYGLSIKVQNTRLVFKQGINDPYGREKSEILKLPASAANFEKVTIQGKWYVSTEALERLADSNINGILLDKRGSPLQFSFSQNVSLFNQKMFDFNMSLAE